MEDECLWVWTAGREAARLLNITVPSVIYRGWHMQAGNSPVSHNHRATA